MVEALTASALEAQALLDAMRAAFDLDTAVGAQLDATGLWIGRTRMLPIPLENVYFQWNVEGFGFAEAAWRGRYDSASTLHRLPDETYRTLLKAKVAANAWDGTTSGAYAVWKAAFADKGTAILMQDNRDMSITIGLVGMTPDKLTLSLLTTGYLPLKPEGVRIANFVLVPDAEPIFALDVDSIYLRGLDEGYWGDVATPVGGEPLFAWNCDSAGLRGWATGAWGRVFQVGNAGSNGSIAPSFAWGFETQTMQGWNAGEWDPTWSGDATPSVDEGRWWGGRYRGLQTRQPAAFAWNIDNETGWAFGAWL